MGIAEAFVTYYASFYKARPLVDAPHIAKYLVTVDLLVVPSEDRRVLDDDITLEEVMMGIAKLKTGKALGPNDLLAEFFKNTQVCWSL
ncbi:hypothetical protein NDU88_005919 [Pleurodeles waltl]|uniref:Uncharacterized protein n=1 Tax=Pleurodeles waltl TaxID=8319 RepID=A0AAV7NSS0_PLEWA|nr:hypothetical protein NDU88_005919 [Pleurodeles waltl]